MRPYFVTLSFFVGMFSIWNFKDSINDEVKAFSVWKNIGVADIL